MRNVRCFGLLVLPLVVFSAAGCVHDSPVHAETAPRGGDALVIGAASCWLGGLWSDAVGEEKLAWNDTRTPGIERRCNEVLPGEALRAIDPRAVDAVARKLDSDAQRAFLREVADAARENRDARAAADRVKVDTADDTREDPSRWRAGTTLSERKNDKLLAGPILRKSNGLTALLHDSGPYAADAQTLALLFAIDRVEIARGLPMHLKIDVLGAPVQEVFGIAPPTVPGGDSAPLPTGTWLSYLTVVSNAAGHGLPEGAPKESAHREPLAWNGMLKGFADKLRVLEPRVGDATPLEKVMSSVVTRLDGQYDNERSVAMSYTPRKHGG